MTSRALGEGVKDFVIQYKAFVIERVMIAGGIKNWAKFRDVICRGPLIRDQI